jgi:D-galacturonate reductase
VIRAAVIGAGMIVHDQLLPSLYHLQRLGLVGEIDVCARRPRTVAALANAPALERAFPGHSFRPWPPLDAAEEPQHRLYLELLAALPPRSLAVIALPDPLHAEVILAALAHSHHVLAVKPLVLRVADSERIEQEARARQLLVAVDYHKRFDPRSLMARARFRAGEFGEFRLGAARLLEKWHYRESNFQNWFTAAHTDAFTYIGCHYVDLVHFVTGLAPAAVSVRGVLDEFPNGNRGYLWTDARIVWENGACLNVQTALGYPEDGPGSNSQGMTLYCSGKGRGAMLVHSDQYRGVEYVTSAGGYSEPSPDYFQYLDLGGRGLTPSGYGYLSVEAIVKACLRVESSADRAAALDAIDREGLLATPANSRYNERVLEAGRRSLLDGGREVLIV